MSRVDLDAFVRWVGARGLPSAGLDAYRRGAGEVIACAGDGPVTAACIKAAVERAERSGRRATGLPEIGQALLDFLAEPPASATPLSDPPPPSEARQLLVPLAVFLVALVAFLIVNTLLYWLTGHVILPG